MKIRALHEWNLAPKEAVVLQRQLAGKVRLIECGREMRRIAATDISISRGAKLAHAAVVVVDAQSLELVDKVTLTAPVTFPYVPGLLSFRELPLLLEAFSRLSTRPDAVICDGQGFAHPRRIGLACHLGLWLGIPTVGCGKSILCGEHGPLGDKRGAKRMLTHKGEKIGYAVRTRPGVKPIYVSPGHLIDFDGAVRLVMRATPRHRLPEPIRLAHAAAGEERRQALGLT